MHPIYAFNYAEINQYFYQGEAFSFLHNSSVIEYLIGIGT